MTLAEDPSPPSLSYWQLFLRFLRFGLLAFGGPVAQIAMIRRDLVEDERWISSAGFNRLLAVMQVLPGPEAHELCVHLGIRARGRIGGLLAGLGFLLWIFRAIRPQTQGPGIGALLVGIIGVDALALLPHYPWLAVGMVCSLPVLLFWQRWIAAT
jgi:hypothetical protein